MDKKFRVLVLGGYGNFGAIIARKLVSVPNVEVIIAGRRLAHAQSFAQSIGAQALHIDSEAADLPQKLVQANVDLLIATVGPFQTQNYNVAAAAIAAGIHYVDIADAREFVCNIATLNSDATRQGVLVVSGASSVPALAAAVIDGLLPEFTQLAAIDYGITSSERLPGLATVEAVLSYCGKPMPQWRDGTMLKVYGWQDLRSHHFVSKLGKRWFVNCDVPDVFLFSERYAGVRDVRFGAGLGLRTTHFGTWLLAWLVRLRLVNNANQFARPLRWLATQLQLLGAGRSGMFVKLVGTGRDGKPLTRVWEISAENNDGINIPCMAAVALARKLANDELQLRGATACVGVLSLQDYLAELQQLAITVSQY